MSETHLTKEELADIFEQIAATLRVSDGQPAREDGELDTASVLDARDDDGGVSRTEARSQSQPPGVVSSPGARSWIRIEGQPHTLSSAARWYPDFEIWETDDDGPQYQFGLGYVPPKPGMDYYGHPRGYWIVHEMVNQRIGTEIAVFVEAEEPSDLVAVIRGNGPNGRSMFDPGEDLPAGYEHLTVDVFRDHVVGPQAFGKLAVVAVDGDRQCMLNHAAIQSER